MNKKVFDAILSMDVYNRGYNASLDLGNIDFNQTKVGNVSIITDSTVEFGNGVDQNSSFYSIAYQDDNNGKVTISYRGTDEIVHWGLGNGDAWDGFGVGGGSSQGDQAEMAFEFYNSVAQNLKEVN